MIRVNSELRLSCTSSKQIWTIKSNVRSVKGTIEDQQISFTLLTKCNGTILLTSWKGGKNRVNSKVNRTKCKEEPKPEKLIYVCVKTNGSQHSICVLRKLSHTLLRLTQFHVEQHWEHNNELKSKN